MYVMRPDNVRGYVKEQGQCIVLLLRIQAVNWLNVV